MLSTLGWNEEFQHLFASFAPALTPARIITQHRSEYIAADELGTFVATLAGRLRNRGDIPAVGDWVAVAGRASIRGVVPRRTAFIRKAPGRETAPQVVAANIDVVFIVMPSVNPRRLERYVAVGWESGAIPVVVLTKSDACTDVATAIAEAQSIAPGVDVIAVSAKTGEGLPALHAYLAPSQTVALLGASGAGKSTLVNALLGENRMATGDVDTEGRGRHTTTHRELVQLPTGALLIDTPGMRELGLWSDSDGLAATFAEIETLAASCRFADCQHDTEPDCAVRSAITPERLEHWRALQRELAHQATRLDAQAQAREKSHDKMLTRAQRARLREKYE